MNSFTSIIPHLPHLFTAINAWEDIYSTVVSEDELCQNPSRSKAHAFGAEFYENRFFDLESTDEGRVRVHVYRNMRDAISFHAFAHEIRNALLDHKRIPWIERYNSKINAEKQPYLLVASAVLNYLEIVHAYVEPHQ